MSSSSSGGVEEENEHVANAERPVHGEGNQQAAKQAQPELLAVSMRTNGGKDYTRIVGQIGSTAWGSVDRLGKIVT